LSYSLVWIFIEWLLDLIAWCIAGVRINRVSLETIEGREFVRKQRSTFGWILILVGNIVFRFRPVPLEVLPRRNWLDWERGVHTACGTALPKRLSRGLLMPIAGGCLLSDALTEQTDETARIELLSGVLAELYRLHQFEIEMGAEEESQTVSLSHGDASINNVIYDASTKSACWFDFDLRHDLRQPDDFRHADDLRAFLFTAVQSLPCESHSEDSIMRLLESLRNAYPNDSTWVSLGVIVNSRWFAFDVFHRAQMFRSKPSCDRKFERLLKDALVN